MDDPFNVNQNVFLIYNILLIMSFKLFIITYFLLI